MSQHFSHSPFFMRLWDICIPLLTWLLITMPLWLSFFHPAIVSYFIIAFDLYFFYKSITTTYLATVSYLTIMKFSKINFAKKLEKFPEAKDLSHFIIIPNYKEPSIRSNRPFNQLSIMTIHTRKYILFSLLRNERKRQPQKRRRSPRNITLILPTSSPSIMN